MTVVTISVITGCTRPDLLPGLYETIRVQTVDWEWVIQLDGDAIGWTPPDEAYVRDTRVRIEANPRPSGSGVTRNQALMRSSGAYVMCVDDDDLLYPDAFAPLRDSLVRWRRCFGAWGRTDTFEHPATAPVVFRSWPQAGPIEPGTILRLFESTGHFAVHVGATLWRRAHLVAVGGYAALPRSIDTNPFLAAESLFPSCYVDTPVYLYRQHGQQMTQTESYQAIKARVHGFTFERGHQLRRLLQARDDAE